MEQLPDGNVVINGDVRPSADADVSEDSISHALVHNDITRSFDAEADTVAKNEAAARQAVERAAHQLSAYENRLDHIMDTQGLSLIDAERLLEAQGIHRPSDTTEPESEYKLSDIFSSKHRLHADIETARQKISDPQKLGKKITELVAVEKARKERNRRI